MAPPLLALKSGITGRRAALAAVLALSAALRLHRLPEQGLLLFDEGFLVREARSIRSIAIGMAGLVNAGPTEKAAAKGELSRLVRSSPVQFAKPAHNIPLAALLSWVTRADLATLLLSAMAGILATWAAFLLGQALFGWSTGIISALILAISPYHLLYSRSGLSDSLTILFWTLSLWAWLKGGKSSAILSGIFGGLCVGANYREMFIPFLFLGLSLETARRDGISAGVGRFIAWLGAYTAIMLALELPYRLAELASGSKFPNGTFLHQTGILLAFHGSQGFLFSGWPAFFHYIVRWEGLTSLAWLAAASAFQFRQWRGNEGAFNLALLVPWILFSAYWDNASRFFSILLPLTAIMKGRWLVKGWNLAAEKSGMARGTVLAAVVLLSALPRVRAMVPRPTPYPAAAKILAESGNPMHYSTNPWLGDALLGPGTAQPFPPEPRMLAKKGGIRFAITDLQALFGGFYRPDERYRTAEWVVKRFTLIMSERYNDDALSQYIFEQDMDFQGAEKMLGELRNQDPALKLFDLARPLPGK